MQIEIIYRGEHIPWDCRKDLVFLIKIVRFRPFWFSWYAYTKIVLKNKFFCRCPRKTGLCRSGRGEGVRKFFFTLSLVQIFHNCEYGWIFWVKKVSKIFDLVTYKQLKPYTKKIPGFPLTLVWFDDFILPSPPFARAGARFDQVSVKSFNVNQIVWFWTKMSAFHNQVQYHGNSFVKH